MAKVTQEMDIVKKENGVSISLKSKLHDRDYRTKIFGWISLPIAMLNLGIIDSQGSAALLDLQMITSTDDQRAALYITSYNLGYVLGSLLGGFCHGKPEDLVYSICFEDIDHFSCEIVRTEGLAGLCMVQINSYFILTTCCVMAGGVNIATPYCSTFVLMFIVRCILGFFLGVIICIVNAEHMRIWGTRGASLLQLINCSYALGGVVGPLMASPFITDRYRDETTSSHQNVTSDSFQNNYTAFNSSIRHTVTCDNFSNQNTTDNFINHILTFDNFTNLTLKCYNHTETNKSNLPRSTNVHYAFLIGGLISVLVAILFLITLLMFNKSSSRVEERGDSDIPDRKLPLLLKVFLAGLLFLYYLFYCSIEVTFSSYILVFIVKHFENISTHEAAYILTYYWALFAAGRFLSIFTSKYFSAKKLLCIHLSMIAAALAGLIASALWSRFDILTVFACLLGLACSATLAAGFSWTEAELMKVTGTVSAVILIGASAGPTIVPFVVGHLVEYVSNMWFCYCLVLVFVMSVSVLVVMMMINQCYVDKKYGKLGVALVQEKPQGFPDIVIDTSYL